MNCGTLPQLEDRLLLLSEPQGVQGAQERQRRGPRRRSSPGGERGRASSAHLGEPADPAGSGRRAGRSRGRSRDRARPGLPGAASAPFPPPLAGWGGARAQRLQLPSGRGPTPPTLGPGPARKGESARERQAARGRRGWAGLATRGGGPGDGEEVRAEGAGSYSRSWDAQNGRKKSF